MNPRRASVFPRTVLWGLFALTGLSARADMSPPQKAPQSSDAIVAAPTTLTPDVVEAPPSERAGTVRRHYLWSNEGRHDLFFPDIQGLQGAYVGVGGDQNYTLAAIAESQVLWLVDLDAAVVHTHLMYRALVSAAPTPAALCAFFSRASVPRADAAITQHITDEKQRRAVLETYHAYRDLFARHLAHESAPKPASRRTWLSDPAMYQHIRNLALARRIVPRLGNLLGNQTLRGVAQAAQTAHIPVRVVYLSNAESWFQYASPFRRNFSELPFDDRSVVLRTIKTLLLPYPTGDDWHYSIQHARPFVTALQSPAYAAVPYAMRDATPAPIAGLSHTGFASHPQPPEWTRRLSQTPSRGASPKPAPGLITRPTGTRPLASEQDQPRLARAQLELNQRKRRDGGTVGVK